jgi:MoaA/NifB/PqqE/SkfB family radical SAM enzyme
MNSLLSKIKRYHLPEMFAILYGRKHPSMVSVNITEHCNHDCIYCEVGRKRKVQFTKHLLREDMLWIIDQVHKNGIPKISICGGEPFLFKGLTELIDIAARKNIHCTVTSNGMIIHSLQDDEIDILKKCRTEVNISIDSFNESINDLTRGTPHALDNALKSFHRLNENGIPVTVLSVITRYNFSDLANFTKQSHSYGIRQVLFQPVIGCSNYPELPSIPHKYELNVPPMEVEVLMQELKKILRFEARHSIRTNAYRLYPWIRQYIESASHQGSNRFFNKVLKRFWCRDLEATIEVSFQGGIQPCGLLPASVFIQDHKDENLVQLWHIAMNDLQKSLKQGHYPEECNYCCHHFSRNMLASVMRYPFSNCSTIAKMLIPTLQHMIKI